MAAVDTGKSFANGEQLTAAKLNQMFGNSTFSSGAVDSSTISLNSDGKLTVNQITSANIADNSITSNSIAQSFLDTIYPIGSIYTNATDGTNPGTLLGFGTWVSFGAGRVPVGIDSTDNDFDVVGEGQNTNGTDGAKTHTLTTTEIPPHNHTANLPVLGNATSASLGTNTTKINTTAQLTSQGNVGENGDGTGSAAPHNNLQPYVVVYMWRRTL